MKKIIAIIIPILIVSFFFEVSFVGTSTANENTAPMVCFIDEFNDELRHGETVVEVFSHYNKEEVNIVHLQSSEFGFYNLVGIQGLKVKNKLNKCDVINYSMVDKTRSEEYINTLHEFIKDFDGEIVAAAGNENFTNEQSQWSYMKEKYKGETWTEKVHIVTQGNLIHFQDGRSFMKIDMSYGTNIDYVVDKDLSNINEKASFIGSSFSTPFITAKLVMDKYSEKDLLEENDFEEIELKNVTSKEGDEDFNHKYTVIGKKQDSKD